GRDVTTGLPRTQEVTTVEIRAAIDGPVSAIIDIVKSTLERTPPELAADVISNGITLSGGGALLTGLTERMIHETGIQTVVADDPLMSVVIGGGLTLENLDAMKGLTAQSDDE
ncbi:MAG: rod shape-determining protein, partial [Actinobacteria bacterium]|nr:rod shape-determining protein [Actinomycetota bacterium]